MRDESMFSLSGDGGFWAGIPHDRALGWTRVFLRHHPSVPGTFIWMVRPNLAKGLPAEFSDWARRARAAEELGFTPDRYAALQLALDATDPSRFPAHPDNHPVSTGLRPVRPFDAERWAAWNRLVDAGTSPDVATAELLSV